MLNLCLLKVTILSPYEGSPKQVYWGAGKGDLALSPSSKVGFREKFAFTQ